MFGVAAAVGGIALGAPLAALAQSADGNKPTIEELERQLKQRDALVSDLLRRVEALEHEVSARAASASRPASHGSPPVSSAAYGPATTQQPAPRPQPTQTAQAEQQSAQQSAPSGPGQFVVNPEAAEHALERALVQTGGLLLEPGVAEIVPSVDYVYRQQTVAGPVAFTTTNIPFGTQENIRQNQVEAAATARVGLPWASQLEISVPYEYKDSDVTYTSTGASFLTQTSSAYGLGDPSITLTKQILKEGEWRPNLFWSVGWNTNLGQTSNGIRLGTGYNEVSTSVLAVKRQDPLVFTAGLQYTKSLANHGIEPGDVYTPSAGVLFAVSPETSLRVAMQLALAGRTKLNNAFIPGSDQTAGIIEFGVLSILAPGLVVDLRADVGVTPDAPTFGLKLAFPLRFDTGL